MAHEDDKPDGVSADEGGAHEDEVKQTLDSSGSPQEKEYDGDLRSAVHAQLRSFPRRYLIGAGFALFLIWLVTGGGGIEGGPALKCEERYTLEEKYGEKPEGQQVIIKYDIRSGGDAD